MVAWSRSRADTAVTEDGREPGAGVRILLEDVSVEQEETTILSAVTLELTTATVAVIGANGSGKSTLARLLNGLVSPTRGRVLVHDVDPVKEPRRARERVGFVFPSADAQLLMPTPVEDVALSLRRLRQGRAETAQAARVALERFGLGALADTPVQTLSGGQKQLLALTSVLATSPSLLVADEPTTMLDRHNARTVSELLLSGIAPQTVIVTHDLELAARCEIAVYLRDGTVVASGLAPDVVAQYREEER